MNSSPRVPAPAESEVSFLDHFVNFMKKYLQYLVLVAIAAGLTVALVGPGISTPRPVILAIIMGLVILPIMVNMRFGSVVSHAREPRPLFCSLALNFILSPALAALLGMIFLSNQPELRVGLIILALLPTSAMSAAWTGLSGSRVATAFYLITANLGIAALIGVPLLLPLLVGGASDVATTPILINMVLVFVPPLLLGSLLRVILVRRLGEERFNKKIHPRLPSLSGLGTLVLVFLIMAHPRNGHVISAWRDVILLLVPLVLYYAALYAASVGWVLYLVRRQVVPTRKAIVIVYTTVTRHINLTLAVILATFPPERAALMVIVPILAYILQVPTMAFFAQRFGAPMVADCLKKEDVEVL